MTNRLVLGEFDNTFVLRVSRPGYNVLNTGLKNEQLAFDSRWFEASNIFMSGTTTVAPGGTRHISFSLPKIPIVVLVYKFNETTVSGYIDHDLLSPGFHVVLYELSASGITLEAGSILANSVVVRYVVLRNYYQ